MKMERNFKGEVTVTTDGGRVVSAKVPKDYSGLGILSLNGLTNHSEYREDGWVYVNNKPVRKWHINIDRIRVWEPKLKDLKSLYKLYKKTQLANNVQWKKISDILQAIWDSGPKKHNVVIAHALPTHEFDKFGDAEPWWEYTIHKGFLSKEDGLSYSFQWVNEKPKKLVNSKLGQKLYEADQRRTDDTGKRYWRVKQVFYDAMKRSLPKATANQVISLQFGEDTFWFYTTQRNGYWFWVMFDDQYQFTIKKIV